jgi:hypothetical protein
LSQTLPERLMEQATPLSAISCWNCSLAYWLRHADATLPDQSDRLNLKFSRKHSPSHGPPPASAITFSRCPRNRQQASSRVMSCGMFAAPTLRSGRFDSRGCFIEAPPGVPARSATTPLRPHHRLWFAFQPFSPSADPRGFPRKPWCARHRKFRKKHVCSFPVAMRGAGVRPGRYLVVEASGCLALNGDARTQPPLFARIW